MCLDWQVQAPQPREISVGNKVMKLRTGDNPRLVMNLLQQKEENQGKPWSSLNGRSEIKLSDERLQQVGHEQHVAVHGNIA